MRRLVVQPRKSPRVGGNFSSRSFVQFASAVASRPYPAVHPISEALDRADSGRRARLSASRRAAVKVWVPSPMHGDSQVERRVRVTGRMRHLANAARGPAAGCGARRNFGGMSSAFNAARRLRRQLCDQPSPSPEKVLQAICEPRDALWAKKLSASF
jgi:hypothetical protein